MVDVSLTALLSIFRCAAFELEFYGARIVNEYFLPNELRFH